MASLGSLLLMIGLCACASGNVKVAPVETVSSTILEADYVSIGGGHDIKRIPLDAEINAWINTISESSDEEPKPGFWYPFIDDMHGDSIKLSTSLGTNIDVLEILTYPEGLNISGVPISTDIVRICGPEHEIKCGDIRSRTSEVALPIKEFRKAIHGIRYFAIGGIVLPSEPGSEPKSFMALLHNQAG